MGLLKIRDENGVVRTIASIKGEKGNDGVGIPEGGTKGQVIKRTEDGTEWVDVPQMNNVILSNTDSDDTIKSVSITKVGLYEVKAKTYYNECIFIVSVSDLTKTVTDRKIINFGLRTRTSGAVILLYDTVSVTHENGTIKVTSLEQSYVQSTDNINQKADAFYLSEVNLLVAYE